MDWKRLKCWWAHRAYWTILVPGRYPFDLDAQYYCPHCDNAKGDGLRSLLMRKFVIAGLAFGLVACAPLGAPKHSAPKQPDARHCADIVAAAMASPTQPVPGVMQCFAAGILDQANQSGVYDDHDFMASIASQPPVFTTETYCGVAHNGDLIYSMATADGQITQRLGLSVERANGLVDGMTLNDGAGCPSGLR